MIVDARFLKLLAKYPDKEGCIVESGGGDREIELPTLPGAADTDDSDADVMEEVIDLCSDDDEDESKKRKNDDEQGDEDRRKRVQLAEL